MTKKMLIDAAHPEEIRVAVLDQNRVEDFDFESAARKPLRGNIYLARVTRVEPSLQAAFVEYGGNRHGFLAFSEIHPDYYQIPVADRERLQAAEAEVADLAAQLELAQRGDEDDDDADRDDATGEDTPDMSDDGLSARDASEDIAETPDADSPDEDEAAEEEPALEAAGDDAAEPSGDDAPKAVDEDGADKEEEEEEEDVEKETGPDKKPSAAAASDTPEAQTADLPDNETAVSEADAEEEAEAAADSADAEEPPHAEAADLPQSEDDNSEDAPEAAANDDATDAEEAGADNEDADDADESDADESDDGDNDADAEQTRGARAKLFERYKEAKRKRSQLLRNYKIQEVIKRRQILLIQVVKEERGNKGAALTTYLSLAGRYCVLMPNTARGGGISRKIPNGSDRRRLRRVVDSLEVPQGMGLIIRTAGAKRTKTEIKRDYEYLLRLWENIRTLTLKSIAPCLIYEEASLIKRAIRDLYDKDIGKVLVEGEAGYREAKDFMKMLMPSHAKHVQPYKERAPVFLKYGVEAQLDGMYQPSVRLKSGGYIVIHQTEALVAIDVNSGRATRERNIELTALKTNIEAAQEAARQFRLRDLAGLIVIDFIDMEEQKNNRKVEKALKDALKADRARIQTGRISAFGLLEMSRQRRRSGIVDGTTHTCPTCSGAGVIRSQEMAALRILRAIEGEAISGKVGRIAAHASVDVSLYLLNHHRDWLKRIENDNGVSIEIVADSEKAGDAYDLEKSGAPRPVANEVQVVRADQTETIEAEDDASVEAADEDGPVERAEARSEDRDEEKEGGRKRRRRRRRKKDAGGAGAAEAADADDAAGKDEDAEANAASEGDEEKPKRRRRRGRRGGRRNRQSSENGAAESEAADNAAAQDADSGEDNGGETVEAPQTASEAEAADANADEASAALQETAREEEAAPETPEAPAGEAGDVAETEDAAEAGDDAVSAPAEAAPADAESDARVNGAASDAAPETPPEQEAKSKKPARKGWWQRATGA